MAEQKANDAAQALLKSFLETNQLIAESMAANQGRTTEFAQHFLTEGSEVLKAHQTAAQSLASAQERNTKFFQSFFTEGMEALKKQTESAQSLVQELEQKTQQQQEAFQQLALQSMKSYFEFLSTPLSAYEQSVQAATRQAQDTEQKSNE